MGTSARRGALLSGGAFGFDRLNRMRSQAPGRALVESWSRGTRVFRKMDGGWQMIHQHLSFPFDLDTGQAVTDLKPGGSSASG